MFPSEGLPVTNLERFLIGFIPLIIVFKKLFIAFSLYSWTVVLARRVQVSHLASLVV